MRNCLGKLYVRVRVGTLLEHVTLRDVSFVQQIVRACGCKLQKC